MEIDLSLSDRYGDPSDLHAHQCLVYAGTRTGSSDWRFVRDGRPIDWDC